MYDITSPGVLNAILGILILIIFFVTASKISKIHDILVFFRDVELRKPENWYEIKCAACGKEFKISKATKGFASCTHCKSLTKLPD